MDVRIEQKLEVHAVGLQAIKPFPQSYQQLLAWQLRNKVTPGKWLVIYWDDPSNLSPKSSRADVVFTVADDFILPPCSENYLIQTIPAGIYAICPVRITDGDFAAAWLNFYQNLLPAMGYQPTEGTHYEHCLNDSEVDGYFDIELYQAVEKIPTGTAIRTALTSKHS